MNQSTTMLPDLLGWEVKSAAQILTGMEFVVVKKSTRAPKNQDEKGLSRVLRIRLLDQRRVEILYAYFEEKLEN